MMKETSTHPCIVKVNSIDWTGIEIDYPPLITKTVAFVKINSALTAAIRLTTRTSSHKIKLCCGGGCGWWTFAGDEVESLSGVH
jgi:predicted RNA-binding Zn ribbon-like protein